MFDNNSKESPPIFPCPQKAETRNHANPKFVSYLYASSLSDLNVRNEKSINLDNFFDHLRRIAGSI